MYGFRSQKGQGNSYIDAIAINQCPPDNDKTQYDIASIIDGNLSFAISFMKILDVWNEQ